MMGAATEKARLPRFSLVLGIESRCEVDDLSCLGEAAYYIRLVLLPPSIGYTYATLVNRS